MDNTIDKEDMKTEITEDEEEKHLSCQFLGDSTGGMTNVSPYSPITRITPPSVQTNEVTEQSDGDEEWDLVSKTAKTVI